MAESYLYCNAEKGYGQGKDIFRYFTTDDDFIMKLYISGHKFTISSKLYNCLENEYKLDLHECIYRISIL